MLACSRYIITDATSLPREQRAKSASAREHTAWPKSCGARAGRSCWIFWQCMTRLRLNAAELSMIAQPAWMAMATVRRLPRCEPPERPPYSKDYC